MGGKGVRAEMWERGKRYSHIALTRIPYNGAVNGLSERMRPMTPCLAAEYANRPGDSLKPATEETNVRDFEEVIEEAVVVELGGGWFSLR